MAKKKEAPDSNDNEAFEAYRRRFIIAGLRRSSMFWPYRARALKNARVGPNQYECAKCHKIFPKDNIQLDHIIPVVKLSGFTDWNDYFNSLLGKEHDWQVLCKPDHTLKTQEENTIRKILRKVKKSKKDTNN